jgi:hypothetical protein
MMARIAMARARGPAAINSVGRQPFAAPVLDLPDRSVLEYWSIRLQNTEAVHAFARRAMAGQTKDAVQ